MSLKKIISYTWILPVLAAGLLSACQKDYYEDSGLQNGVYALSSLDFLEQRPFFFDSVVTIIHLAGMDDVLKDSLVTFFAPTDHAVARSMDAVNSDRHSQFKDSLRLEDIPQEVWKKFLSRYIFKGKYMLKDIARRDASQLNVYPGMNMESWDGYIMNLGVVFSDYEGTKDVGPRQVVITSIGDLAAPDGQVATAATSDLQTKNGVIHVLDDSHSFGFAAFDFAAVVDEYVP